MGARDGSVTNALAVSPAPGRVAAIVALALVVAGGLSGCELLAARSGDRVTVEMTDRDRFSPGTVEVPRGTTVVWVNRGRFEHTTTSDPDLAAVPGHAVLPVGAASWDSGPLVRGATWDQTFDVPGTYVYFCQAHEMDGMLGSITVTD
jgi:plastocyanin